MTEFFIGTACDSRFVELTCAMLSSLDDNGDVAEATIVLAAFDLTRSERRQLRRSAGGLGERMRFLPVTRDSALIPVLPSFDFPFPMLGCLLAPKAVNAPASRMLLLDSDMIVNRSLRPLFEIDLRGHPLAAVRDMLVEHALIARGRKLDPSYFNSGLLLIDVDAWRERDIADRAMRWLAAHSKKPEWPDQDALNAVVDGDWLRLDRRWNFAYCGEDRLFTLEEFGAAHIVHYAGAKPTECRDHPAVPIYDRHAERAAQKTGRFRPNRFGMDREFIASAYEVLFGREVEGDHAVVAALRHPPELMIAGWLSSPEFREAVIEPLTEGRPLPPRRFPGRPSQRQLYWAADRLPILGDRLDRIAASRTWRELLSALVEDERLMACAGLPPVAVRAEEELASKSRASAQARA